MKSIYQSKEYFGLILDFFIFQGENRIDFYEPAKIS